MDEHGWLTERFEAERPRMRAVGYRMLGSLAEADDAVQEAWLRVSRADASGIENMTGWLTTIVARVCLNMLASPRRRREEPLGEHLPDPVVGPPDGADPEAQALIADSVGLALQVVLDRLVPAERLAFVLHDIFAVPFEEIAPIVDRSPTATRQLASRARRRVRVVSEGDADVAVQRAVVDAFLDAARRGDFQGLLAVLDPDVVLRGDGGRVAPGLTRTFRGARVVAEQAVRFARLAESVSPALVNGAAGIVAKGQDGRPFSLMGFSLRGGRIIEIDVLADPERIEKLDLATLEDRTET